MAMQRNDTKAGRFYRGDDWGHSPLTGTADWPSVTHILGVLNKPALVNWAASQERQACVETAADFYGDLARLPKPMDRATFVAQYESRLTKTKAYQRETQKATDIGSQAHKLIEWSIRKALGQKVGPEPKVVDQAMWAYMAFQDWAAAHTVKPIFVEQGVYHPRLGYAGTLDLYAEVDGVRAVVDFKTSKAIYAEAHLQNVAYQDALIELGHEKPETGYILRIPKSLNDPAFEVQVCPSRHELLPVFRALLRVWMWWWTAEQAGLEAWKAKKRAQEAAA